MSSGSDDDVSVDAKPARREPSQTAAQTFAEISDDESDDGRLPQRNMAMNTARTPSPPMDDEDEIRPQRRHTGSDSDADNDDRFGSGNDDMKPAKPKVVEAHERSVVENLPQKDIVDLLHFPPGLEVSTHVATEAELAAHDAFYPISFRPQRRGDARSAVRSALQRGGAVGIAGILESNARLIEWSDGSHTVMVGDEHYYIMNDKLASDFYLFRKGQDIQTVEAAVNTVGRLQPYNAGGLSSRLSKLGTTTSPAKTGRKLLLTTKRSGEIEEQQAKDEADRKDREKERLQRKRRATIAAENRNRPRERSPIRRYSDEEDEESDGEAERFAEEEERRIKRRRNNDWSFKHQKAGRRKIVGESDDEESDE